MSVKFMEQFAPYNSWIVEFAGYWDMVEYWHDVECQYDDGDIDYIIVG